MVNGRICKIALIIFMLIFISIACPVYAEKKLVADQAALFTAEEEAALLQAATALGGKYKMDIVIVTTSDAGGKTSREYADDYFDDNGYGVGDDRDGILLLLDFDNREAYISTSGSGIKYLTDERIERILDDVFNSGLTEGDNYGAANAFLKSTERFLAAGIPENQQNVPVPADDAKDASYTEKRLVADQAALFTAEEEAALLRDATALGEKYKMDIVIVTTSDAGGKSSEAYAADYFYRNGYGMGENKDGILFLLDLDNEAWYISTSGSGTEYLTDERVKRIQDDLLSGGLNEGDLYGATTAFLRSTGSLLAAGISNDQPDDALVTVKNTLSTAEAVVGAIIAGIIGFLFYFMTKIGYEGIPVPGKFEYKKNSVMNLSVIEDNLVNSYITSRIIPKADKPSRSSPEKNSISRSIDSSHRDRGKSTTFTSSSSTTHTSSSGRSHGGGGRKF